METLMKTHGRLAAEIRAEQGGDEPRMERLRWLQYSDLAAVKAIYAYNGQRHMEGLVRKVERELEWVG